MPCPDSSSASDALAQAVSSPAEASGDAGSVRSHSLPDLIAADQYEAAKCAAGNRRRGVRFNRLVPDGAAHARRFRGAGSGFGFGPRQDF